MDHFMDAKKTVKNTKALKTCGILSFGLLVVSLSLLSSYLDDLIFYMLCSSALFLLVLWVAFDPDGWRTDLATRPSKTTRGSQ